MISRQFIHFTHELISKQDAGIHTTTKGVELATVEQVEITSDIGLRFDTRVVLRKNRLGIILFKKMSTNNLLTVEVGKHTL